MPTVRLAIPSDLEFIVAIYNEAVLNTTASFDLEPVTVQSRADWFANHQDTRYPLLVAEADGEVMGWASLSPWAPRKAYGGTAENSIYVSPSSQGSGVGSKLLRELIRRARDAELHTIVARVADGNPASLRLHERAGFVKIGTMREVGHKFGRFIDVDMLQLML